MEYYDREYDQNAERRQKRKLRYANEKLEEYTDVLLNYYYNGDNSDYCRVYMAFVHGIISYIEDFKTAPCLFIDSDAEDLNSDSESDE